MVDIPYVLLLMGLSVFLYIVIIMEKRNSKKLDSSNMKLFNSLTKVPIIKNILLKIKDKLYLNSCDNTWLLEVKSVSIFMKSLLGSLILTVILFKFFGGDFFYDIALIFVEYSLYKLIENYFIGDNLKLLEKLMEFIRILKHNFEKTGHVENSFIESTERTPDNITQEVKKMHASLVDGEDGVNEYCKDCPNKFLRVLELFSYLILEYGDSKLSNGNSLYASNLNYLVEEIKMEHQNKEKTNHVLNYVSIFTLIAIFLIKPFEMFSTVNFPETLSYFNSGIAYVNKIIVMLLSLLCTVLIKKMKNEEDEKLFKMQYKDTYWQDYLLKFWLFRQLIKPFMHLSESKKKRWLDLIERSGENIKLEWLALQKALTFIIALIISLALVSNYYEINRKNIMNNPSYKVSANTEAFMETNNEATVDKDKILEMDNYIISNINPDTVTKDEVSRMVISYLNFSSQDDIDQNQIVIDMHSTRIMQKIIDLKKQNFTVYSLIISFVISYLAMQIPVWVLYFQQYIRKQKIDSELFQFQMIILLLKDNKHTNVYLVIEWMERFSDIFSAPLQKCLNSYNAGPEEALAKLNSYMNYFPFNQIVENLLNAEQNTDVKTAFDSLETDRRFYREDRKEMSDRRISEKNSIAGLIGKLPLWVCVICNLIVPIIITAYTQANMLKSTFNNIS